MGREAKREGVPPETAASTLSTRGNGSAERGLSSVEGGAERGPASVNDGAERGPASVSDDVVPRWFEAIDPASAAPLEPRRRLWAAPLFVTALVAVAVVRSLLVRALLPLALAAAGILVLARRRRPRAPAAVKPSRRGLSLAGDRIAFHTRGQAAPLPVLSTGAPFGVTLLAAPGRDRVVALLSGTAGAFYVGAAFDSSARRVHAPLLDQASIVGADEVGLAAIGPDGEPIALSPDALGALLDELARRAPGCLDRLFLTDARGAPLSLDGRELRAGERAFDLGAPLEWRAFVFQEALGQAVALYQGTWVRQGSSEVVLVCLLPAITPAPEGDGVSLASLDRSALRDLRLMQGAPEDPPPADQRVAVDRLVMLPIRSALDKAPRTAAQPPRARA